MTLHSGISDYTGKKVIGKLRRGSNYTVFIGKTIVIPESVKPVEIETKLNEEEENENDLCGGFADIFNQSKLCE